MAPAQRVCCARVRRELTCRKREKKYRTMTICKTIRSINALVRIALIACGCALISACGGAFGTSDSTAPGNTPNIAGQVSFRVVGTLGTPFSLLISDADSSWQVQGVVPLSIVIINTKTPVRMVATKLVNNSSLLSIEIISGFSVVQLSSTTAAFSGRGRHTRSTRDWSSDVCSSD